MTKRHVDTKSAEERVAQSFDHGALSQVRADARKLIASSPAAFRRSYRNYIKPYIESRAICLWRLDEIRAQSRDKIFELAALCDLPIRAPEGQLHSWEGDATPKLLS